MPDYCEVDGCKSGAVSKAQADRTKAQYGKVVCNTHEPDAIKEVEKAAESLMSPKERAMAWLARQNFKESQTKGLWVLDGDTQIAVNFNSLSDEFLHSLKIGRLETNSTITETGHGLARIDDVRSMITNLMKKGAGKNDKKETPASASLDDVIHFNMNMKAACGYTHSKGQNVIMSTTKSKITCPKCINIIQKWPEGFYEEKHPETKVGEDEANKATETAKPESKGEVKVMSESRKVSAELVPVTEKPQTAIVANQPTQGEIIERAITTSKLLVDIVEKAKLFSMISGKKYVRVEGWETLGALLLCSSEITKTEEYKNGYKSEAIIRNQDGKVISNGVGICLRTEKNWSSRDDFAICSMSQTRAIGKAYRLGFAWIMSLAGYEVCPAEETELSEVK